MNSRVRFFAAPSVCAATMTILLMLAVFGLQPPLTSAFGPPPPPNELAASQAGVAIVNWEHDQIQPAVAYNSYVSEYMAAWEDHHWGSGTYSHVYARRVASDGTPQGTLIAVSWEGDKKRLAPDIAYGSTDREYLVVWESVYSAADHDIFARRLGSTGSLNSGEITIAYTSQFEASPAVAYNSIANQFLIIWTKLENPGDLQQNNVWGQLLNANGSFSGSSFMIASSPLDDAAPAVAYNSSNNQYLVVWQGKQTLTHEYGIYGQRVYANGVLAGGIIGIETWEGDQIRPRVAYAPESNRFLVVWQDLHWGVTPGWYIYGQLVNADGTLNGTHIAIGGGDNKSRVNPDVAYKAIARSYFVAWEYEFGTSDHDVYYRRVAFDGTLPQPAVAIASTSFFEGRPALASGPSWGVLMAWEDGRSVGTLGLDIYGQGLQMSVPTLTGNVYSGTVAVETTPLAGVPLALYCSSSSTYTGTLAVHTTTNAQGAYALPAYGLCDFYHILETDLPSYVSSGSTTTGGVKVDSNWIRYTYPLVGKVLTGNKFWDYIPGPVDREPPGGWTNFTPGGWVNQQSVACTVQVQDTFSGLDTARAEYAFSTDAGVTWTAWQPASCTGLPETKAVQTITSPPVPFGQDTWASNVNRVRFRIPDVAGNMGTSSFFSVLIDTVAPGNPTSIPCSPAPGTWSWNNQITCQWSGATDGRSGIAGYSLDWDHSATTVPGLPYETSSTQITSAPLEDSATWYLHVRAVDRAGNGASGAKHAGPFKIDTVPPWSSASAPAVVTSPDIYVTWSGGDNVSGVESYDIQVNDLTASTGWVAWVTGASTATGQHFTPLAGHRYCFRSRARDGAGHVEAWPASPTGDACSELSTDLAVIAVEVTQGVQSLLNDVPLVFGKETWVRVYAQASRQVLGVNAELHGRSNGAPLPGSPLKPVSEIDVNTSVGDRDDLRESFLFILPPSWRYGTVEITAEIDPEHKIVDANLGNNTRDALAVFNATSDFCLAMVSVAMNGWTSRVDDPGFWDIITMMERILPVRSVSVYEGGTVFPEYGADGPQYPRDGSIALGAVGEYENWTADPPECSRTIYYGMLHPASAGVYGLAYIGEDEAIGTMSLALGGEPWTYPWGGFIMAHELGHNFGRKHINCHMPADEPRDHIDWGYWYTPACNLANVGPASNYGLVWPISNTVSQVEIITPTEAFPLMGYGSPRWIDDYTYRAIFNQVVVGAADQMATPAGQQAMPPSWAQAAEYLYASGFITPSAGTGSFSHVYRTTEVKTRSLQSSYEAGLALDNAYSLVLKNASGGVLATHSFTPTIAMQGAASTPLVFGEFFPWVAGAVRVSLYQGATELAYRLVSAHNPSVTILSPAGGESFGSSLSIRWQGQDADPGTALDYVVQYSPDDGATWRYVASDVYSTQLTVNDVSYLPGSTQARIRVTARDGVNTAQAVSNRFALAAHAPGVSIIEPRSGMRFTYGSPVVLRGMVHDAEDNPATLAAALQWTSDVGGGLGTGPELMLTNLVTGTHRITLRVTDSGGQTGQAQTVIKIEPKPKVYLPIVLRRP